MLRPLVLSLLLVFAAAAPALAAKAPRKTTKPPAPSLLEGVEIYSIDSPHSEVGFTVPWMGISRVHGSFQDFIGSIAFDESDLTHSAVMVVIRTKSINTGFERRDKDLKSPNFFDVEKFPSITFASREIVKQGDGFVLRGPLTIHGITKEIEIPFVYNGKIADAGRDRRVGFEGHLTLQRKDYGIVGPEAMNAVLDKGIIIGETVDIPLAIEGWRATVKDSMGDRVGDSLCRVIATRGVAAVAKAFREKRATTPDSLMDVNEGVINSVGYQLLYTGRTTDARDLFRLETEAWPKNVFGYVGLGQTHAMLGERDLAIETLEKAIAITPEAPRAQVILKKLKG